MQQSIEMANFLRTHLYAIRCADSNELSSALP